ncbi:MAG: hypothetical protein L3J35_00895 [Bacteroidales bacterium]|nr:hypothetical protein [Bacteroidales bacterium]
MKKLNIPITTFLIISVLFSCKRVNKCDKEYFEIDSVKYFGAARLDNIATCTDGYLSKEPLTIFDTCISIYFDISISFDVSPITGNQFSQTKKLIIN